MEHDVTPIQQSFDGPMPVPGSKSVWQRLLALRALADGDVTIRAPGDMQPAQDVIDFERATDALGRFTGDALGTSRDRLRLDVGLGATGFRLAIALAALRPARARTLVTGRPGLLRRPHRPLLRALGALGVPVKRRASGAVRVLGGGLRRHDVDVDVRTSSQFASALMLIAPRAGGLTLRFPSPPVSRAYLELTREALAAFGVPMEPHVSPERVEVPAAIPHADTVDVAPDASAAAAWWAAAALTGSRVWVPGLTGTTQPDTALLALLARMGARVEPEDEAWVVTGTDAPLVSPGEVDLRDTPDLLPLVAVLAARARGDTTICGVAHARGKESDRIETVGRGLASMGARVEVRPDGLRIGDGPLHGADIRAGADHRIAFAFGVLGLVVPGVRLLGAESVSKSDPRFLEHLETFARGNPTGVS